MKNLAALNKYFFKYKWRLLLGILFISLSNYFAVIPPVVIRNILDQVHQNIQGFRMVSGTAIESVMRSYITELVFWSGLLLLGLALIRGLFMFLMRQTIIVMSRLIEYDQKNEIYAHYQRLDTAFFKANFTGDLMNRISEDVSRVRMYTGPSLMYAINLIILSGMCLWAMVRVNPALTFYVLVPLPILATVIYLVNRRIFRKSENIQTQLSDLTSTAQESYSGIRVIKSFVQESNRRKQFFETSRKYRDSSINLALTEAIYFPAMNLFIGLSMLSTVLIGGYLAIQGRITPGNIAEFVIYINLLMFPISSIGWVASMMQRAGASQKRINAFLETEPQILSPENPVQVAEPRGSLEIRGLRFRYQNTGTLALDDFDLDLPAGSKVAIIGRSGSGKSTLAHLITRMYDPDEGEILLDGVPLKDLDLHWIREQISYVPQEPFLFSDTVYNNIRFGREEALPEEIHEAARMAHLSQEIEGLSQGYDTLIGERGILLSGGQKQRLVLARAIVKKAPLFILDESLSAVDTQTEKIIRENLRHFLSDKSVIVITHRLFTQWDFDQILVMDQGRVIERGTHESLMQENGKYAALYRHQTEMSPSRDN